jgi:hypothetical protein
MSGAAIRPIAQAVVADLVIRFGKPVIGTGGIIQAEDAVEMTMVGATALGVCTAPLLRGLEWFARTHEKLQGWLDAHGHTGLADLRAAALPQLHAHEDTAPLTFAFEPLLCTKLLPSPSRSSLCYVPSAIFASSCAPMMRVRWAGAIGQRLPG